MADGEDSFRASRGRSGGCRNAPLNVHSASRTPVLSQLAASPDRDGVEVDLRGQHPFEPSIEVGIAHGFCHRIQFPG